MCPLNKVNTAMNTVKMKPIAKYWQCYAIILQDEGSTFPSIHSKNGYYFARSTTLIVLFILLRSVIQTYKAIQD